MSEQPTELDNTTDQVETEAQQENGAVNEDAEQELEPEPAAADVDSQPAKVPEPQALLPKPEPVDMQKQQSAAEQDMAKLQAKAAQYQKEEDGDDDAGQENAQVENAQAPQATGGPYTYELLQAGKSWPADVDPTCREQYLTDDEFSNIFQMTREDFKRKPTWKQRQLKIPLGLF